MPFAFASSDGLAVFTFESLNLSQLVSRLFFSTFSISPLSTIDLSNTKLVVLNIVLAVLALGDYLGLMRTTKTRKALIPAVLVFFVPSRNIVWWSWGIEPRTVQLYQLNYKAFYFPVGFWIRIGAFAVWPSYSAR